MTHPVPDAKSVFGRAAEIPSPAGRAAFLAEACAGHPAVHAEVETLLKALGNAGSFMAAPAAPAAETASYAADSVTEGEGTTIGPYTLRELIGEGGFGLVFVAEQQQPIRRKVALKVIKPGMDTKQVIARFEAERQALALMDHPNIATVLDAGTTESGRPYFVMELVRGVPITEYADANNLTPRDRLGLFVQVCQAVQHAHQKGVIHRDLKPTNILVAPHDGVPVVKVIDFGVAKALGQSLTDKTIYTRFAQMIGTPLYMSPEQAEVNQLDVDTRSDVYSLGVLLYELLTGTTPFDRDRFRKAAFDELRRIIKEEEPPRPSTRLTLLGATLPAVSAKRGTEPGRLAGLVRGELDWIAMKALEKDRSRRYETAVGLAKDVQRYLAGEAVEACPPTLGYRVRKFVRRNRASAAVAAVVLATLLTGIAGTTWGLIRADAERARVVAEEQKVRGLLAESEAHHRADELRLASATIDLDVKYLDDQHALGLVRLARTLRQLPPHARELREFVAMTLIAQGQESAPLLPPFLPNGEPTHSGELTPDGRTALTEGRDARLWDARTGRPLAVLRQGSESHFTVVLSGDGQVAATVSKDGIVRFWDVPAGRFRAATAPVAAEIPSHPEEGYDRNDWFLLSHDGRRFLSAVRRTRTDTWAVTVWDGESGRAIARLARDESTELKTVALSPDGHHVLTSGLRERVSVWSADTGERLRDLGPPGKHSQQFAAFSPSGRRAVVVLAQDGVVHWWDADDRRAEAPTIRSGDSWGGLGKVGYVSEDLVECWSTDENEDFVSVVPLRHGATELPRGVRPESSWETHLRADKDVIVVGTRVYDPRTRAKLFPQLGETFHSALGRYSIDGRWLVVDNRLVDLAAGKVIWPPWDRPVRHVPGVGFGANDGYSWFNATTITIGWVPLPGRLPPDDLLELWVQVVARGELGPHGEFVKWTEEKWEEKRRELAAHPVPHPDFPFPGRVATDRLHWLRRELDGGQLDDKSTEVLRIMRRLLRMAEEAGNADEAAFWRREVEQRTPHPAPSPREVKR